MDEPASEEEMDIDQDNSHEPNLFTCAEVDNGKFQLSSFITHLGASVHAGHYVCHIRKGQDWIYYNDAKVAKCPTPPFGKGFIYVFDQK